MTPKPNPISLETTDMQRDALNQGVSPQHTPKTWERLEGVVEVGHPIYKPGTVVTRIVEKREPGQTDFAKIALVDSGPENARLIAALPVLLAALEEALEFVEGYEDVIDGDDGVPEPNKAMTRASSLRAAISLATGEVTQ